MKASEDSVMVIDLGQAGDSSRLFLRHCQGSPTSSSSPGRAAESFTYRLGVMPNAALNVRVKWAWSAKPAPSAVSARGRASRSQPRATSRRRITEYRYGLVP